MPAMPNQPTYPPITKAEVFGIVTINNDSFIKGAVDNPNVEPWFLIKDVYLTNTYVITQDAKSFHKILYDIESRPMASTTLDQFTATERPIIKSAIKNYVEEL